VNEVTTDVDAMPNAWYFRQVRHGVYVRMALLTLVLGAL
jgi:aspartate carbamoyltransferase catalytic subunit